jgi:hypothetical protein
MNAPFATGDILARLEHARRVDELNELAAAEGLTLPLPAPWIATLESAGVCVNLLTGEWTAAERMLYTPTQRATAAMNGGAL